MDTTTDLEHGHGPAGTPDDVGAVGSRRGVWLGLGVALGIVVVDQVVKWYVEQALEPGEFVPWLSDDIGWQLVYNDGGAFGLPMPSWFFLVVTVVVVVLVVRNLPRVLRVLPTVSYGLLLAGALGNVVDRLVRTGDPGDPRFLHGHVVDFVAWGTFPRFNVADSAITIGFALLAWDLWRHGDEDTRMPGTANVGTDTGVIEGSDDAPGTPPDPHADTPPDPHTTA